MKDPVLVKKYRVLDHDLADLADLIHSSGAYEQSLFIPDAAHIKIVQQKYAELEKRVAEIEVPDPVFEILQSHYCDYLESIKDSIDGMAASPVRSIFFLSHRLLSAKDSRDDSLKLTILEKKLAQIPVLWEAMLADCTTQEKKVSLYQAGSALCGGLAVEPEAIREAFAASDAETHAAVEAKFSALRTELTASVEALKAELGDIPAPTARERRPESATLPLDIEGYRKQLRGLGVNLDELLEWHEAELEKTRNECLALAAKLDVPEAPAKNMREVNDILFKYAGPADSPEEMFERANSYIKRTRAIAHEYVWLPEEEQCTVDPVPPECLNYPWGGYGGGCEYRRPMKGGMFLNNFNYKAITDGWIKINCLHEAYPGHHVQWIRKMTDPIPETFKRGAKSVPLMEGTCIRTERAFEFVYADDPFYPLFAAYRRHHGTVRIMADLMLHYYQKTVGEALNLYIEEMGLDYGSARSQVETNEHGGYYTAYYYGLKKLEDWQKLYGYDKKTFTEFCFSVGGISMENFERFLKLSDEDKYSLTHEFGSLYQFK